ncbi:MAG: EFR1 family ferrodoxin [Candidatus Omnitrophica bacterium]|jgi:ferredoxin|nr:EFR1 family ferrodoxin [Candidatus Omnitrophota bacterium]
MKTIIFYFSGTGNCLKVALDLAKELKDAEVISIPKAIKQKIPLTAESVGLIYPVYMFGMPLIVSRFIEKLRPFQDKYFFAIATCGGMAANSLGQTKKEMQQQGLKLSAGFIIKMPGNYTPLYEAISVGKQKEMFEREEKRIRQIATIIKEKQTKKIERNSYLVNWLFSAIYKLGSMQIPKLDKNFWVDDNCNGCGICQKVCPVNNIKMLDDKPQWLCNCEQCFACFHWCPQEAIQYQNKTVGKKRYRNPQVKLEYFISY